MTFTARNRSLILRSVLVLCLALLLTSIVQTTARAQTYTPDDAKNPTPADKACSTWYDKQSFKERQRESNEQPLEEDIDKDGCNGKLAASGSDGPVPGALKDGSVSKTEPSDKANGGDSGSGSAGDGPAPGKSTTPTEDTTSMDGTPSDASQGDETTAAPTDSSGDGGLNGMVWGFFQKIMTGIWDWTFGWALESMGTAFKTDLLSLPTLDGQGDLLGFYSSAVEKLRPAVLVGILLLGILMMVRSDNYDLAYAGFQGLPRLMGVAMALAFLPTFMGELSNITAGITQAFFPSGQSIDAAGQELFKAAVGNMAVTNFLNLLLLIAAAWVGTLLVIVALMNKILYAVLFLAGAFALTASLVPSLYSLAGSWFRGVLASAAIPALWSIELGVGTLVVTSPETIFGGMTNALGFISESAVTSLGAIITMWLMYKTPFKCIEWAFNVHLPGRGGLMGLAKTGAALAIAIPAKTAIAQATRGLMNRSSGSGGGSLPTPNGGLSSSKEGSGSGPSRRGLPGTRDGAGGNAAARKIQQTRTQGQRDRVAQNASKAHFKYAREKDRAQEGKERFMQGGRRGSNDTGMRNQSGDRSTKR